MPVASGEMSLIETRGRKGVCSPASPLATILILTLAAIVSP